MGSITKGVIPVAGLGTRFLPATKAVPKEMLPVVDTPAIQYIVEEAVGAGLTDIVFITGRGKTEIEDHFDLAYELNDTLSQRSKNEELATLGKIDELIRVIGVRQKRPLGLGHAIYMAHDLVAEEAFAVLLGDDLVAADQPAIGQLIEAYEKHKKAVVAVERVPHDQVHRYGVVGAGEKLGDNLTLVSDMVEKPPADEAPSDLAIIGRYVLPTRIFDILENTEPGRGGEIQLTDALRTLAASEGVVACEFEGTRYDTGNKLGWIEANLAYALRRKDLAADVKALMQRMLESS